MVGSDRRFRFQIPLLLCRLLLIRWRCYFSHILLILFHSNFNCYYSLSRVVHVQHLISEVLFSVNALFCL
jgi:hypothetical protein